MANARASPHRSPLPREVRLRHQVGQHLEHFGAQRDQDPGMVQLIALSIEVVPAKLIVHGDPQGTRDHAGPLKPPHSTQIL
jgi:hypothetical protein